MFWQDTFDLYIRRHLPSFFHASESPRLNSFILGLAAGSISGFSLNVMQAIKFRMWSLDSKRSSFLRTAWHMYREGGVLIFFRGCIPTVARDSVFGIVYETVRGINIWQKAYDRFLNGPLGSDVSHHESVGMEVSMLKEEAPGVAATVTPAAQASPADNKLLSEQREEGPPKRRSIPFISNMIAATLASIISSPFNYVRSVVYGTPPKAFPLSYTTLHRSFLMQFLYVYHNGESYVEKYTSPKYRKVGHDGSEVLLMQSSSTESSSTRPRPVDNRFNIVRGRMLQWSKGHHPVAACQWASTRLNVGWGSIRVGLGMAISQGTFHLIQECIIKFNRAIH
ncbi:unnamed protein product [Phytomonas sp. EM1]|nr:unnamed protein product [Phytomonas sp. EM1]|eukprot:CCW61926.1 unnamed protein product [Phytomonas sp. isolate EM1]